MIDIKQLNGCNVKFVYANKNIVKSYKPYFYDDKKNIVYVDEPRDVVTMRDSYPFTYEANIKFIKRIMIDHISIPIKKEEMSVCWFDIETDFSLDTEHTPKPITAISCKIGDENTTFVWRKDLEKKVDSIKHIHYFDNEIEMLKTFILYINTKKPHIISGYNSDNFDVPYIENRCKKLGINFYLKSKAVMFDMLSAERRLSRTRLKSYSLEFIANKILGTGKLEYADWSDIDKLVEYNKMDVELLDQLNKKQNIINIFDSIRRTAGCLWQDVFYFGRVCEVLILREAKKRGMILPTEPKASEGDFKGAYVMEPVPGLHHDVATFDLRSLYPSIMKQFNISFDTLDKNGDININGIKFKSKPEGIIPFVITDLWEQREAYKKKRSNYDIGTQEYINYDSEQLARKLIANALYGYCGDKRARIYDIKTAKSVTYMGRYIIKWTKKIIEAEGYEILYIDTDGIYFKGFRDKDELYQLLNKINDSYDLLVRDFGSEKNDYIINEFECIFKDLFFTEAKKKYIGRIIHKDGKDIKPTIEIKGFETKRSDFSDFGAKTQLTIINMILDGADKIHVDRYIKLQKEIISQIDIKELATIRSLTKPIDKYAIESAYVRGAKFANMYMDENFGAGDKMHFIYGTLKGYGSDVVCFSKDNSHIKDIMINYTKTWELVQNKIDKIYDAMKWSKKFEQHSLFNFGK